MQGQGVSDNKVDISIPFFSSGGLGVDGGLRGGGGGLLALLDGGGGVAGGLGMLGGG